ncbi:glycosyltransferase family 4 protein [Carnobacterium divergens]|uniref:glycosyltransferase family 4 protein n=1 Tax=Carnobacterium divergens TaxID=2748 RepID=UPI001431DDE1|nr:glycosyltransferase family 4 protein [Carnobacterium divergens]
MKILYIHQYYQRNQGGTRSYELAKYFQKSGAEVTIITGSSSNSKDQDKIQVKSTHTSYNQKMSKLKRIFSFIHFSFKSILIGLGQKDSDIIYGTSTPLTVGLISLFLSKWLKKPYIFEVRDVWPDIPIELGYLKNRFVIYGLKKCERLIYKHASHIIVLSSGMKVNLIAKGVDAKKITVAENMVNNELVIEIKEKKTDKLRSVKKRELQDWMTNKFIVVHPGTMGVVNDLDYLLRVAELVQPYPQIAFLLIGEGSQKSALQEKINSKQLENIVIVDEMSKIEIFQLMEDCDLGDMNVMDNSILWDNSANKFFDFLAIGLPIIINYQGWQKQLLESTGAGASFKFSDIEGYCNYIVDLSVNHEKRNNAAQAAKNISHQFEVPKIGERIFSVIKRQVGK